MQWNIHMRVFNILSIPFRSRSQADAESTFQVLSIACDQSCMVFLVEPMAILGSSTPTVLERDSRHGEATKQQLLSMLLDGRNTALITTVMITNFHSTQDCSS